MTSMVTSSAESAGNNRRWFREHYHDFVPHVGRGLAVGMTITASEYLTVQRARHRIREALRATYEKVDIIASPTTSRVAPLLSEGLRAMATIPAMQATTIPISCASRACSGYRAARFLAGSTLKACRLGCNSSAVGSLIKLF